MFPIFLVGALLRWIRLDKAEEPSPLEIAPRPRGIDVFYLSSKGHYSDGYGCDKAAKLPPPPLTR